MRKVGVFVTGFSSSYLSLSLSPISTPSAIFPPPYFHRSLSLIVSPSFFYHLFSLPLTSIPPSPSLTTHPPTNQQNPSPHSTLTFPPHRSLYHLFSPPPVLETRKTNAANRTLCESRQENETGIKTRTTRTATLKSALGYFKLKITARFQTAPGKNLQPNESPTQRHSRSCRTRKQEKVRERWNDEGR